MQIHSILFIHPTLTHYHYPRLQALARDTSARVTNIELAGSMRAYPWGAKEQPQAFQNVRLFPDQALEQISTRRLWSALRPWLVDLQPQVVFLYGYSLQIFRQAKSWCDRHGAAAVLISDSNNFDKPRNRALEFLKSRLVRRYAAGFVGGTSSSLYLQKLGLPAERIVAGYDVIDVAYLSSQAEKSRKSLPELRQKWQVPEQYFLMVARLVPEKNLPGLLTAYARYHQQLTGLQEQPWPFVLCGSGPEELSLRKMLREFPQAVRAGVRLFGYVQQPEILDLFAAASCLILPSLSESWGLVVNEALACSLPVLVTERAGCARDLVQDNINGWTFNPRDLDALTDRMVQMTHLSAERREQMGQRGRMIIADWDLDRFAAGAMECSRIALEHSRRLKGSASTQLEELPLAGGHK